MAKNQSRDAAIVELVRSGKKQADVARGAGLTRERVRQICVAAGLEREERTHFKKNEIDLEAIHQRNMNGESIAAIAESCSCSGYNLATILQEAGYEVIPYASNRSKGIRRIWTEERVTEMYNEYAKGLTYNIIAKKYGTYQPTVSRLFKEFGFKANGKGRYRGI